MSDPVLEFLARYERDREFALAIERFRRDEPAVSRWGASYADLGAPQPEPKP